MTSEAYEFNADGMDNFGKTQQLLLDVPKDDLVTHMDQFKKNLVIKILFVLVAFFIIFFQAFFYENFYPYENRLIVDIQSEVFGEEDVSLTMRILSYIIQPYYIHLITLCVGLNLFYGSDPILGIKYIINNLIIFSLNKLVILFHQEPRPFWLNPNHFSLRVDGYGCYTTYSNPDMSVVQAFTMSLNLLLLDAQLSKVKSPVRLTGIVIHFGFFLGLVIFLIMYLSGEAYLSQFLVTTLYCFLYYNLLSYLNPTVTDVLRKCTLDADNSFKRHMNYLMVFLIAVVTEVLVLMGYNSKNLHPKTISNYVGRYHM